MPYTPLYTDPRVARRVRHALGFALAVMSTTTPRRWGTRVIDKHFGQQQKPLSRYLREHLLITTDNHYSKETGKTKEYLLNQTGVDYLRAQLMGNSCENPREFSENTKEDNFSFNTLVCNISNNKEDNFSFNTLVYTISNKQYDSRLISEWCLREFGSELANLEFTYEDKSGRLWHPIQNIRREHKQQLLAQSGLKHNYDIECCAPTLIHQHAQQLGQDQYLFAIAQYISDKTAMRNQIADTANTTPEIAKVLVNSLFCGARLGVNSQFALSQLLDNNKPRIQALQQDPYITQLRADIKLCWQAIEPDIMPTKIINKQTGRKVVLNSRMKWNRYFDLERRVLNAARRYLKFTNNKCFLEHDGWTTQHPVDQQELIEYVLEQTGFQIRLTYAVL